MEPFDEFGDRLLLLECLDDLRLDDLFERGRLDFCFESGLKRFFASLIVTI